MYFANIAHSQPEDYLNLLKAHLVENELKLYHTQAYFNN